MTPPTVNQFKARYQEFVLVPDETVQYWLTDGERFASTSWIEADYPVAIMACAAHHMVEKGVLSTETALPEGVTRFKSGTFEATISEKATEKQLEGGFGSTRYGREYEELRYRNTAGTRLVRA